MFRFKLRLLLVLMSIALFFPARGQYFGRNKPQYEKKKFQVVRTPHFEIYHYLRRPRPVHFVANELEMWYQSHFKIFRDSLNGLNPVIVYNDHPDFKQTTAISGDIGVGTGGVTDALKQRIVFPFAMTNQQTHHVIGHEMVHAFQYNLVIYDDSMSLQNLANLPLWMTEGLAEYMSIGRYDSHTALWMREAVMRKDGIPKLKKLDHPDYFPYRWGHAFWAFLTARYGDDVIQPLYYNTALMGLEDAIQTTLGISMDSLSTLWQGDLKSEFGPQVQGKKKVHYGKRLLTDKNAGYMNIAPSISPNGRYLVFLSEKELFSMDLYLADALNGKILHKLTSSVRDGHIDALNFMESTGTWSPHSDKFAYVVYVKGSNRLMIKDVKTGKKIKEVTLKGVPAFSNPTWSPDGKTIVVTGLVEGQLDLFAYDVKTGKVRQLTDDQYDEVLPEWSPDGRKLVFSSDEWSQKNGRVHGKWTHNITVMDVATGQKSILRIFNGADNLNPVFDSNGDILFLSNRDGYRNMYRFSVKDGKVYQMTDLPVGVTGITPYAPTISVARKRDRIVYNEFHEGKYVIRQAKSEKFLSSEVAPDDVRVDGARLFKPAPGTRQVVDTDLDLFDRFPPLPESEIKSTPYKSKFKLDYLAGSTGVGIGTGNFGSSTALAGGIQMLFSDILGRHQVMSILSLNGDILDFGGLVTYVNQVNKLSWGVTLSHIPYRSGRYYSGVPDTLVTQSGQTVPVIRYSLDIQRLFENKAGGFVFYPFSTVLRVESGLSYNRYGYKTTRYNTYTDYAGFKVFENREKKPAPTGFNLYTGSAAVVGDNSYFGMTAPLKGYRFRFGGDLNSGEFKFNTLTLDYRHYFRLKPVTLALRAMHFGRYGKDHDSSRLYPVYVGNPFLVRGFYRINRGLVNQVVGSKVVVGNAELRLPFTGPKRLALIPSKFLFSDLNLFLDGGYAYYLKSDFDLPEGQRPVPLVSTGVSLRINLFGALVVEPYYAWPLGKDLAGIKPHFGLTFAPGF